jgi:hypothetical protein
MIDQFTGAVLADLTLARRIEAADIHVAITSAHIHASLFPASGAVAEPFAGGFAIFVGVDSPLTQALGLGMEGSVTGGQMDRVEAFFLRRSAPVRIELCPLADPSLLPHIGERGYRIAAFSNMMARKLRAGESFTNDEQGITIQSCEATEDDLWARTIVSGFGEDMLQVEQNIEVLKSLVRKPDTTSVLAWYDGRPAGGGAMSTHDGVAALYGASTLPGMRRLGVQTAVLRFLLGRALDVGCDLAYTLTHPGSASQHNLERQGFRVAYTRTLVVSASLAQTSSQHGRQDRS